MLTPRSSAGRWHLRISFAALTCLTWLPIAHALNPAQQFRDYAIDNWGPDSSLPQVSALSITQDSTGYIWIGTQNGLARFDGLRFEVFDRRNSDGTEPLQVNASLCDRRGRLWFGTPNGVLIYENEHFRNVVAEVPAKPVHAIIEGNNGEVWIATSNGVMRSDGNALVLAGDSTPVHSLARDGNAMWVGGTGTVTRRAANGERVFRVPGNAEAPVARLAMSEQGLWIGTMNGLYLLPTGADLIIAQPLEVAATTKESTSSRIENLFVDRDGNLWVGTPATLFRRRPNGSIERVGDDDFVHSAYVISAFEDREGNLWLGSYLEGLFRLWNGWTLRLGAREGLTDSLIWSVTRDPAGQLVIGSNSNVMRLEDSRLHEVLSTKQIANLSAYELNYDARGRLWVGMRSGLAIYDQGLVTTPEVFSRFARTQVNAVLPHDDVYWIGSHAGLFRYDGNELRKIALAPEVAESPVRGIHIAADGTLTVSTEAGVRRLDNDVLRPPAWAKPLEGRFVTSITTIRPDLLGITTRDSGIGLMSDDHLLMLDDRNGLPTNNSWGMQTLDDYLYVPNIDGVWRVSVAQLPDPGTATNPMLAPESVISRRIGVQQIHCCTGGGRSRVQVDGTKLWFPTIHGVVGVDTKAIVPPPLPPSVVVEKLRHEDRWYRAGERIDIDSPRRDIELQFTALSFREPGGIHFRYRLDGYDSEWRDAGTRRTAFYTNLPPGHYQFRVEARSSGAKAQFATGGNSQRAQLSFDLVPRWFERRSIQAAAVGILLILAALAPLVMRGRYRRRRLHLEALVVARTGQLRDANTRQIRANEALQESNSELATQIQERLAGERVLQKRNVELQTLNHKLEDTQSQLIQSEKMASVGQLAAGVAHEINNPIGFVHSNVNVLEQYVQDIFELLVVYRKLEEAEPAAHPIIAADLVALRARIDLEFLRGDIGNLLTESLNGLSRVEKIVRDLMGFSHLGETHWQIADIHEGLESTLNVIAHEIKHKAKLTKEYSAIPKIECQPFQLNQVFLAVLVNAAHAIEEHGEILIRTEADENEVRVRISDNGKGISEAHLNRIFEPFFTTKPIGKGTGLGLSVSYGIVQNHGGTIDVISAIGKGATFTIHLPILMRDRLQSRMDRERQDVPNVANV